MFFFCFCFSFAKYIHVFASIQSVVEFLPPPFWNEQIDSNEECEVSLVDLDTKDETNKVTFLYYSVQGISSSKSLFYHGMSKHAIENSYVLFLSGSYNGMSKQTIENSHILFFNLSFHGMSKQAIENSHVLFFSVSYHGMS